MIELRWLEYESHSNPETGEHFSMPSTYRKLQFRTRIMNMGQIVTGGPVNYTMIEKPMGWTWSEWQDVPTVAADSRTKENP